MKKKQKEENIEETGYIIEGEEGENVSIVREIAGIVLYIAIVIAAVWLANTFVGQRTVVNGSSMYNTLEDGDNLWVNKFAYLVGEPERFDIVVFPVHGGEEYYIKRVIGMPGETIRIDEEGTIYVNDIPLEEDYGYETITPDMVGRAGEPVALGEDEYFVMGDNRNESFDSRFEEVGNIERERMMGKAIFRIWPFSSFGKVE
ncbi:MAG: signal peptidase I [Bacteroidales bacterium]|nr:signal peptidase I [Clostridium sp.]MCM1203052.1 signal peptidase I [Bacteroidales bacterium]